MRARQIIEAEANLLLPFMQQATQEILDDPDYLVYGGKAEQGGRNPVDGYDINCGLCEEWAERVRELYAEATGADDVEVLEPFNITGLPEHELMGHVFIRFQGRFYDAECHDGAVTWEQLPLFVKNAAQ